MAGEIGDDPADFLAVGLGPKLLAGRVEERGPLAVGGDEVGGEEARDARSHSSRAVEKSGRPRTRVIALAASGAAYEGLMLPLWPLLESSRTLARPKSATFTLPPTSSRF